MKKSGKKTNKMESFAINAGFESCSPLRQKSPLIIKLLMVFFTAVLLSAQANSFTTNSSGKTFDFAITSGKSANISSSNFMSHSVIGDTAIAVLSSSGFKTELGFLRTLYYLDGESCQANSECFGGYCCSSVCQNSACTSGTSSSSGSSSSSSSSGGGVAGGGGGGSIVPNPSFSLDKSVLKAVLLTEDSAGETVKIENTGNVELKFNVNAEGVNGLLIINEPSFTLKPNEIKELRLDIFAPSKFAPDAYTGRIAFEAGEIKKTINVIIDIKVRQALFDIKIMPKKTTISEDESAEADIILYNLGTLKPVDVILFYSIKDLFGNDLVYEQETFAVKEQKLVSRKLKLPQGITPGSYLFYSKLTYNNQTAVSSSLLTVIPRELKESKQAAIQIPAGKFLLYLLPMLLVVLALAAAFYIKRSRQITVKIPKERHVETGEGQLQIFLEEQNEVGKVVETISFPPKQKPAKAAKRKYQGKKEIKNLLDKINYWKKQGYDTSLLELEIKALENKKLRNTVEKIKDWKKKGYNTLILEEELKNLK